MFCLLMTYYGGIFVVDFMAFTTEKVTSNGFTLDRAIQSGVDNQDSGVGIYAGDEVMVIMDIERRVQCECSIYQNFFCLIKNNFL